MNVRKFELTRRTDIGHSAIAWNNIPGFLLPNEVEYLYRIGVHAAEGAQILEIGSFFGLSSTVMATGLKDSANVSARLHCVDSWENYMGSSLPAFEDNCRKADVADWIQTHVRSSEGLKNYFTRQFDVVFIDGDHSYEGCLRDLMEVIYLVKPGGKILGHDFASYSLPVIHAVRDFIGRFPALTFSAPEQGLSIFTIDVPRNPDLLPKLQTS